MAASITEQLCDMKVVDDVDQREQTRSNKPLGQRADGPTKNGKRSKMDYLASLGTVEAITLGAAVLATLGLIWAGVVGSIALFGIASGQNTIGYVLYFACWVFLFPAMILVCILFGLYMLFHHAGAPPDSEAS
jgi:hypothetical protein